MTFVSTADLLSHRALVMLGAAGAGKSFELNGLARQEQDGVEVEFHRLVELGTTPGELADGLNRILEKASEDTAIYLDAFDEVVVPIRTASLVLEKWIKERLRTTDARIRISCRSAVWPPRVSAALRSVCGDEAIRTVSISPLSDTDIAQVATVNGIDPEEFSSAIENVRVQSIAKQPLGLKMLMELWRREESLPSTRVELFRRGIRAFVSERAERREVGTSSHFSAQALLNGADWLACFTILSGIETFSFGDSESAGCLGCSTLLDLPTEPVALDHDLLQAIAATALCESVGAHRFRFAHRQFAEFLAGRRIATLPPHQAQGLLACSAGRSLGVAGPVRETAAFAAIENADVAQWLAESDPEVVGLSDVADASLRRTATLHLLARFRTRDLTAAQLLWWESNSVDVRGLKYDGADEDLRPCLLERGETARELLAFACLLVDRWQLSSLSAETVQLFLDSNAPHDARVRAGTVLDGLESSEGARAQMLTILPQSGPSASDTLKAIALDCNWPQNLSSARLLSELELIDARDSSVESLLGRLDAERFDCSDDVMSGLQWARSVVHADEADSIRYRIVQRIARAAVTSIRTPDVADAIVILLAKNRSCEDSPLNAPESFGINRRSDAEPQLCADTETRRDIIEAVFVRMSDDNAAWLALYAIHGSRSLSDFVWLLERATDEGLSLDARRRFADWARLLPWWDDADCVEAWQRVREIEPIASLLEDPETIEEKRRKMAERFDALANQQGDEDEPETLPVKELVDGWLARCEQEPGHFPNLCRTLNLKDGDTHFTWPSDLKSTPGWEVAIRETRDRIVDVAASFLEAPTSATIECVELPLQRQYVGYGPALHLLAIERPFWFDHRAVNWWEEWSWLILRGLSTTGSNEFVDGARLLVRELHEAARSAVEAHILRLAESEEPAGDILLRDLFELLNPVVDPLLDASLVDLAQSGRVSSDRSRHLFRFALRRSPTSTVATCVSMVSDTSHTESSRSGALAALLLECASECWSEVCSIMFKDLDLARRALMDYATTREYRRQRKEASVYAELGPRRASELCTLLLRCFPPESDPDYGSRVHPIGPLDNAIRLRSNAFNWLGDHDHWSAVESLDSLIKEHGDRYPWIVRLRSRAARNWRLAQWSPVPVSAVAQLIHGSEQFLVRSEQDVADGIRFAVEKFEASLGETELSRAEELWNTSRSLGVAPTPKSEEFVSDRICRAVRSYFSNRAVTADREIQVFRRQLPGSEGEPGSLTDLLIRVPAVGSAAGDPIAVPIEVKFAHNPEAKSSLRKQLVDRYMDQLGAELGVYLVVWMECRSKGPTPCWPSIADATADLELQAKDLGSKTVKISVIDGSFR